jgi:transketolase
MNVDPQRPDWEERDRFVLSKGHAAPMLYATLAARGFFEREVLDTLRELDSPLQGHPCMFKLCGVDMSTGSLGMGISVAVGMALNFRLKKQDNRVFVLCGDGELQEGQNWEAIMALSKWNLNNVTIFIDRNTVQLDGTNEEIMPMGDIKSKMEAFGMNTLECDGHDVGSITNVLDTALNADKPSVIIAHTIKGKGVSFMEGKSEWHGKPLNDENYAVAKGEIERRVGA